MTFAASWTEARRLQSIELSLIRQVMQSAPPNAINLALGELGFSMPNALKEQAIRLLNEGNPAYTPNAGLPELRFAVAETHKALPEEVLITNGAEEAVFIALLSILNPGDVIAIPDPDYTAYPAIARILDAQVRRLPFGENFTTIDWENWERLLAGCKVIILSAPSNPSGFCFSDETPTRFAELVHRHSTLVIVDEIYSRLWFDETPLSLETYIPNLIRIGGLSKSHLLSGWRLGWIIAPQRLCLSFTKARQYISTCSNWLSQKLATYALSDEGLQLAESVRMQLKANRDWLRRRFSEALPARINALHFPPATPYILMKTPEPLPYCQQAAQNGVVLVPGQAFGQQSQGWVRLNFGVEIKILNRAIELLT
jgi:aspartate aminotransferase